MRRGPLRPRLEARATTGMSLTEARYCAMGKQCENYGRRESEKPAPLAPSNSGVLCFACKREGHRPEDAPKVQATKRVAESGKIRRCSWCGGEETAAGFWLHGDYVPLCAKCRTRAQATLRLDYRLPSKDPEEKASSPAVKERFG